MTATQRLWRRLRRWSMLALAGVLVSAAATMALARLLLPWWIASPEQVSVWLGERIGRSVTIDSVAARWDGPGPVLDLQGLRIDAGDGDSAVTLGQARVQLDVYALVWPRRHLIRDFLLVDARVDLLRDQEGQIAVQGFHGVRGTGGLASWLGRVGNLGLSGGELTLHDAASGKQFSIDGVELRVGQQFGGLRIGLERRSADRSGRLRLLLHQRSGTLSAQAAELYFEAVDFPLGELHAVIEPLGIGVTSGRINARQWVTLSSGQVESLSGDWRASELVLVAPAIPWLDDGEILPQRHLPSARVAVRGNRVGASLHIDARATGAQEAGADLEMSLRLRGEGAEREITLAAQRLPVALVASALELSAMVPPAGRGRLYTANPQGMVEHLQWSQRDGSWQLDAELADVSLRQAGPNWPEVQNVALTLSADADTWLAQFNGRPAQVAVPGVFPGTFDLESLSGLLAARRDDDGNWVIEAPQIELRGTDYAVEAYARIDLGGPDGPHMEAFAHVPGASIAAAKNFWVLNHMPPQTVTWLNRALSDGQVVAGTALFRGAFRDWPFWSQEGRFEARFAVEGAALDYHRDWPKAEQISADVAFINNSLLLERASGQVKGNRLVRGNGGIARLGEPVLDLDLGGEGDAADWLAFLKHTPLQRQHGEVLFGLTADGPVDASVRLRIPLKKSLGSPEVSGEALARGMQFGASKWGLDFGSIHGRIDFSDKGFAADRLNLQVDGSDAALRIAVGAFTGVEQWQVDAQLKGRLPAQALFGRYDALDGILARVQGASDWDVTVQIPASGHSGDDSRAMAQYRSNLVGTEIQFPAPLGKLTEQTMPLMLSVPLPISGDEPLQLDIGPKARLIAHLGTASRDFRGQLQFGPQRELDLPSRGLRVSGSAPGIDLGAWAGWLFSGSGLAASETVIADVDIQTSAPDGQGLGDSLSLERVEKGWLLALDSTAAKGTLRLETPESGPTSVLAQFEHLYLPEPTGAALDFPILPAMVPTLHFWIGDLRIGAAHLGAARLEAYATADGLRVDLLEARSPNLEIHAKGDWTHSYTGGESHFSIRMTSEDLGQMLTGLGYAGVVEGGQTLAEIDARWRGAPYAFALERLVGSIKVSVGQGRFLDVDPGAGRIFGLLSVRELPRRLSLDFRDLFKTGMSFDRIEGKFQLDDGNAWTDNLTVRGPAADILIIGRTGLASRDYDQQVMVAPRMSGVLPVIGGLAAGPVGAAAGLLAQGVTSQGDIERSSRVHYSIGGSWEKPLVARLMPMRPDAPPRRRPLDQG